MSILENSVNTEVYHDYVIFTIYNWSERNIYFQILDSHATSILSGNYSIKSGTRWEHEEILIKLRNKTDEFINANDIKQD